MSITCLKVRDSSNLVLLSIFGQGKDCFSVKGLFDEEKMVFFRLYSVFLRLGEGVNLLTEDWCYV